MYSTDIIRLFKRTWKKEESRKLEKSAKEPNRLDVLRV